MRKHRSWLQSEIEEIVAGNQTIAYLAKKYKVTANAISSYRCYYKKKHKLRNAA